MDIPARFNGPPGTGNGGWSAGAFAAAAGAWLGGDPVEVTLRVPPPLDTPLSVTDEGVRDEAGTLIASLAPASDFSDLPGFVAFEVAAEASKSYPGFTQHPFPTCYVCGPDHPDGLRIFPGPVGDDLLAAPWTVPADVEFATVWAALDCPGGWTALREGRVVLLGRIAATVAELPKPGASCVVVARPGARSGRKAMVDTVLYAADGRRLAAARATWIAPA